MTFHDLLSFHIKPFAIAIGAVSLTSIDTISAFLKAMLLFASLIYMLFQIYYIKKNKGKYKG